jgi:phage tail protein X
MSYTKYITQEGDRWDTIAYKAYGVATQITPIIEANPGVAKTPVLPSGITLFIPLMEKASINTNLLPPWKR